MKKVQALFKEKRFVVGVIVVIIITCIIFTKSMENLYDYLFVVGFDYLIIRYLYLRFYSD